MISEVKTREAGATGTHVVFRSLVNGLDVALHLENLEEQQLLALKKYFVFTECTLKSDGIGLQTPFRSYLPGLDFCRFRCRAFDGGGDYGQLYSFLLRLLWTGNPKRSQRIDPIPDKTRTTVLQNTSGSNVTLKQVLLNIELRLFTQSRAAQ